MLKVVLSSFFFIILAELAWHTVSLLGQLVFCTTALFGILKIHYQCGRVVKMFVTSSPFTDDHFVSVPDIFFLNYNIHDIFSILIFHKQNGRFYLYFL